jgi:hypothetical protein
MGPQRRVARAPLYVRIGSKTIFRVLPLYVRLGTVSGIPSAVARCLSRGKNRLMHRKQTMVSDCSIAVGT